MNFTNYKYKLVVSVCLMQSEKSRIKEIIEAYNIRLNTIYSSISSMLDDLEKINFIEKLKSAINRAQFIMIEILLLFHHGSAET